jgi:uncharacterized repeat protein (TIGR03803 family)
VIEGSDGHLYGTTSAGGQSYGTVFRLAKDGTSYTVLRVFADNATDAKTPYTRVLEASDGALYGTTFSGGAHNVGAVYRLNKDGSQYAVLHSFSMSGGDGQWPAAPVMEATDGVLYGTTSSGGSNIFGTSAGVIFRLNKDGTAYQVIRNFTGRDGDGSEPRATVTEATDGILYGTTARGGSNIVGTLFRLNKDGSGYVTLRSFSNSSGDGREPRGELIAGADETLYGVTATGGALNFGTIFKVLFPPRIVSHPVGGEDFFSEFVGADPRNQAWPVPQGLGVPGNVERCSAQHLFPGRETVEKHFAKNGQTWSFAHRVNPTCRSWSRNSGAKCQTPCRTPAA